MGVIEGESGSLMPVREQDQEETHFLNVDVDVWSKARLEPLIAAFGRRIGIHYVGDDGKECAAHFSLAYSYGKNADTLTRELATLVTKLPRAARRLWDNARVKDFNIAIQAGIKPHSHEVAIKQKTVALVVRVGGRVVITTYAAEIAPRKRRKVLRGKSGPPNNEMQRTKPAQATKLRR